MKNKGPEWLKDACFYEIYPQSFYDSNGDGIGDINGITEKLDYVRSLGCNALWINPCFESPFRDAGYDISDYYKVAPRYGTNEDLENLFSEAHKKGIRVCLDLVPGHTSIEHPWFKQSCSAEKNKYSNWYIWTDDVSENYPNAIKGFAERDGNYITNFFWSQPALNYGFAEPDPQKPWQLPTDNPDVLSVRAEIKNIMRFWLDKGADGFRVDMAASLVKNDKNGDKIREFWQDIRGMLDKEYPDAAIISEWSYPVSSIGAGFHVDFMIHFRTHAYTSLFRSEDERGRYTRKSPYSYFDESGRGNIMDFLNEYMEHYNATKESGYISLPTGNHDMRRLSINRDVRDLKIIYTFLLTMPGIPFIYYGDEIGMHYQKNLISKEGGYDRTGSRTPMQWTCGKNAGFSQADESKLYLPVEKGNDIPNVEEQDNDSSSLLNTVRKLINIRRSDEALGSDGSFCPLYTEHNYPFIYMREKPGSKYIIGLNPSGSEVTSEIDDCILNKNNEVVWGDEPEIIHKANACALKMGPKACFIIHLL